jgi:hypothetical protein
MTNVNVNVTGIELVAVDLYKDIHKGIRAELFAATSVAGSVDPADGCGRIALADHVRSVAAVLGSHAQHEDLFVDPVLRTHLPDLAEQVTTDHEALESRFGSIVDLAETFASAAQPDQRRLGHWLYLELASFTSAYLGHQDLEERTVMPALERAVGVGAALDLHVAIVSSIPPDEMVRSLAFMLPAMNLDDRTDLLMGMRMSAPPEAFGGVLGLAQSVLGPAAFTELADRLALG